MFLKELKIKRRRKMLLRQQADSNIISDYNIYLDKPLGKRALLSYLVGPVIDDLNNIRTERFSNVGIARAFPKVLNRLGYTVDIINWDNDNFKTNNDYDLIIPHGAKNFNAISSIVKPDITVIHFLTGSYWKYNNREEARRFKNLEDRRDIKLPRDRFITEDEDRISNLSDGIITIGDNSIVSTFPKKHVVFPVPIAAYPLKKCFSYNHNFVQRRTNFLYFAGGGNVHKGLDILLEVFTQMPHLNLHIITPMDEEFAKTYATELKRPNIFNHGEMQMRSASFNTIASRCGWIVLPSCSEGQPGSVVEGMMYGLIPIVSTACHLDVEDFGITLNSVTVKSVAESIEKASEIDAQLMKSKSARSIKSARENHSPERFEKALFDTISSIIKEKTNKTDKIAKYEK